MVASPLRMAVPPGDMTDRAAGFGISQGHQVNQVNLSSLAADVLFETLNHLSVVDV